MKTAEQRHKERPDLFSPDGYDYKDAPIEVAEAFDAAQKSGVPMEDFLPPPSQLEKRATKVSTTIRLDADLLTWFKSLGKGYQTKMNAILRAYKKANEGRES